MGLLSIIVPKQEVGAQSGASAKLKCHSQLKAKALYAEAHERLMDVNRWAQISGALSASFQLCDKDGNSISSVKPEEGHLIRIGIPAPGNAGGEGYDWVKVMSIKSARDNDADEDICAMRVSPVAHPQKEVNEPAHFYTKKASSTFVLLRRGRVLHAMEFGRNEIANQKAGLLNSWRNRLVAWAARIGLATPQWKSLMKGVLRGTEQGKR